MKSLLMTTLLCLSAACSALGGEISLPWPVSNNAVALAQGPDGPTLYSFLGLGPGKSFRDIVHTAAACPLRTGRCSALPDVPLPQGRLAATAATVGGKIHLMGGYSVDENAEETSNPEVLAFDPMTGAWQNRAPIPVPVDDSVALAYRDRFVYLVSGWHEDGNVARVQVFDSAENRWFEATPFPGTPVFGHAGGIVGNRMVIADGVAVLGRTPEGRRRYGLVDEAWEGVIDPGNPAHIAWRRLPPHPGRPAYRMAATGSESRILFAGGAENPYNYNGIGYDGQPSPPSARLFGYDLAAGRWVEYPDKPLASMDHRGMLAAGSALYVLGGMTAAQTVTNTVQEIELSRAASSGSH